MLDNFWVCLILQVVFSFIESVIYKHICNALISDCPSNDKKLDSKDNLISWNYTTVFWSGSKKR